MKIKYLKFNAGVQSIVLGILLMSTLMIPSIQASGGQIMTRPMCSGTITQEYGGSHSGIDIAAPCGTPIYATANGIVMEKRTGSFRGDTSNGGAGNFIVIKHKPGDLNMYWRYYPDEEWTKFYHLNQVYVQNGQYVCRGQLIGTVGNTGNTQGPTGYHLHFEIRNSGRYGCAVNPREYIRFCDGRDIW